MSDQLTLNALKHSASLWQQVGQRVDSLDKALPGSYAVPQRPRSEKTFWQEYQTGFARWAGRWFCN